MIMPQPRPRAGQEIKRRLAERDAQPVRAGRVHLPDQLGLGRRRRRGRHPDDQTGHQHVIITGRRADPKLIEIAQLVTEMTKIKHPFDDGQKGQRGIEW